MRDGVYCVFIEPMFDASYSDPLCDPFLFWLAGADCSVHWGRDPCGLAALDSVFWCDGCCLSTVFSSINANFEI